MQANKSDLRSIHALRLTLEDALGITLLGDFRPTDVSHSLRGLAGCLESWCRVASLDREGTPELVFKGDDIYDALDLLKARRQRAAFQLRILAAESNALHGAEHEAEYGLRVRQLVRESCAA